MLKLDFRWRKLGFKLPRKKASHPDKDALKKETQIDWTKNLTSELESYSRSENKIVLNESKFLSNIKNGSLIGVHTDESL